MIKRFASLHLTRLKQIDHRLDMTEENTQRQDIYNVLYRTCRAGLSNLLEQPEKLAAEELVKLATVAAKLDDWPTFSQALDLLVSHKSFADDKVTIKDLAGLVDAMAAALNGNKKDAVDLEALKRAVPLVWKFFDTLQLTHVTGTDYASKAASTLISIACRLNNDASPDTCALFCLSLAKKQLKQKLVLARAQALAAVWKELVGHSDEVSKPVLDAMQSEGRRVLNDRRAVVKDVRVEVKKMFAAAARKTAARGTGKHVMRRCADAFATNDVNTIKQVLPALVGLSKSSDTLHLTELMHLTVAFYKSFNVLARDESNEFLSIGTAVNALLWEFWLKRKILHSGKPSHDVCTSLSYLLRVTSFLSKQGTNSLEQTAGVYLNFLLRQEDVGFNAQLRNRPYESFLTSYMVWRRIDELFLRLDTPSVETSESLSHQSERMSKYLNSILRQKKNTVPSDVSMAIKKIRIHLGSIAKKLSSNKYPQQQQQQPQQQPQPQQQQQQQQSQRQQSQQQQQQQRKRQRQRQRQQKQKKQTNKRSVKKQRPSATNSVTFDEALFDSDSTLSSCFEATFDNTDPRSSTKPSPTSLEQGDSQKQLLGMRHVRHERLQQEGRATISSLRRLLQREK
ncbi:MAG: hypothetical protein MHM6MM_003971 [Cercozoa sp. M6MM]